MAILASGFLFAHRICEGYNPPEFRTGPDAEVGSRPNRSEHPRFRPVFFTHFDVADSRCTDHHFSQYPFRFTFRRLLDERS